MSYTSDSDVDPAYRERFFEFRHPSIPLVHSADFTPIESPLKCLDTHLDANLILLRVLPMPSFPSILSGVVERLLERSPVGSSLPEDIFALMLSAYDKAADAASALDIAVMNLAGLGRASCTAAQAVLLNPDQPELFSAFYWAPTGLFDVSTKRANDPFVTERYTLRVLDPTDDFADDMSPANKKKLIALYDYAPYLANSLTFCPSAEWCLADMDDLSAVDEATGEVRQFPWRHNSVTERPSPVPRVTRPPDAPRSLLDVSAVRKSTYATRTRTTKRKYDDCDNDTTMYSPGRITLPRHKPWRPSAQEYVQRAWTNSVRINSTFMIFNCGNFVRIGLRHRQSQTLFLSPMIDTRSSRPSLGRLWFGLHLAIIEDVQQRCAASTETEAPISRTSSASPPPESGTLVFPGKLNPSSSDNKKTSEHFSRSALALYVQTRNYNSPAPQIFLSPGRSHAESYGVRDYMALVLGDKFGSGAVGDVYQASPAPWSAIRTACRPLVAKLATSYDRLCRLRHEYSIYRHLQAAGIKGIPILYGYYQDVRRNAGALILSNSGRSLGHRRRGKDKSIAFTDAEKDALRVALKEIHAAGVLHRDVRSWNILMDERGQVSFIDFDRASLRPTADDLTEELERLEAFMEGEFIDEAELIGSDGIASNIRDILDDNASTPPPKRR